MKKVYSSDMRSNLKSCLDMASEEPLLIERRNADNLVILSEESYNQLISKEPNNLEILIEQKVDTQIEKRLATYVDFFSKMKNESTTK